MNKYLKFFILLIMYLLVYYFVYFTYVLPFSELSKFDAIWLTFNVLIFIISFLVIMSVITKRKYVSYKTFWLIVLLVNPVLGLFLYFIFARDYKVDTLIKNRPLIKDEKFLDNNDQVKLEEDINGIFEFSHKISKRTVYQNNTKIDLLNNGDEFYPKLKETLINAKKTICMQFYILKNDDTSKEILDILKVKSKQGVKCYLQYDYLGSKKYLNKKYMKSLKESGVNISAFEPGIFSIFKSSVNFRNHRKITIVDSKYGFIGGINLGDEYNHLNSRYGFWRDSHIMVSGYGVNGLLGIFLKDWYYATKVNLECERNNDFIKEKSLFMAIESGPDYDQCIIKDIYYKMLCGAKKSIKIASPYLVIEPEMMQALKTASMSGVKVDILVPGKPDKFLINQATKSYYEELTFYGINVYEYKRNFMHSKILIIDDEIVSLGTVNFDPRSFNLNFEATTLFTGNTVKNVVDSFKNDLKVSTKIEYEIWRKRSYLKKVIQGIMNLLSPLL